MHGFWLAMRNHSSNKPFHSYGCACALGRVNRYPESCR